MKTRLIFSAYAGVHNFALKFLSKLTSHSYSKECITVAMLIIKFGELQKFKFAGNFFQLSQTRSILLFIKFFQFE